MGYVGQGFRRTCSGEFPLRSIEEEGESGGRLLAFLCGRCACNGHTAGLEDVKRDGASGGPLTLDHLRELRPQVARSSSTEIGTGGTLATAAHCSR